MPRVGSLGSGGALGFGFGKKAGISPPVNTVAPVASGTSAVGQTLTTTTGTWTGVAPITYAYQWYYAGSNPIAGATGTTVVIPVAAYDWYIWCVVTATNAGGSTTAQTAFRGPVTGSVPSAPTIGLATATGTTTATVNFNAPSSSGGPSIQNYKCYTSGGTLLQQLNQSSGGTFSLTGLTASTTYAFYVTATNSVGTSANSSTSNSITTQTPAAGLFIDGVSFPASNYVYPSGTAKILTVSGGTKQIKVWMWGAGGGAGSYISAYSNQSGSGGLVIGTFTVQASTNYYLYIGKGGNGPASSTGAGGLGGWPNGGFGTIGDASGGGGGGMSMISKAVYITTMADADILMVAGGGGGSCGYVGNAGAGGGSSGQATSYGGGGAGTQTAGGAHNGGKLFGGNGISRTTGADDGGGGGGGYYGGGASIGVDGGNASGGSGYFNVSLVSSATLTTGTTGTPPNPNANLPATYAVGKTAITATPQTGGDGIIYIQIL